jgi:hypothetical protein
MIVIKKYKIMAKNIYNFNKKGFIISFRRSLKRIIILEALKSGRVTKSK